MRTSRNIGSREWERLRHKVLERDGHRCTRCGLAGKLEVHHLIPVERGGQDVMANLTARCRTCHLFEHRQRVSAERQAWRDYMRTESS